MSRILAKIITDRFSHAYENQLSENQFGFRKNRGTTDAIFVMKNIIEKYGDTLVVVYVDLTAAYDHIPRELLFQGPQTKNWSHHSGQHSPENV